MIITLEKIISQFSDQILLSERIVANVNFILQLFAKFKDVIWSSIKILHIGRQNDQEN